MNHTLKKIKLLLSTLMLLTSINVIAAANPQVRFETSHGNFLVELYPEKAPKTVDNFLQYVNSGFYKGTIFHRVINNFMIQGGGFDQNMVKQPTNAPIINESDNGLVNDIGTLAMARTNDPNSATSQFFINLKYNQFLDFQLPTAQMIGYCVFGKVLLGMDVIREIGNSKTGFSNGHGDVPKTPVIINNVIIIEE